MILGQNLLPKRDTSGPHIKYLKMLIISPGLLLFKKPFLEGLIIGENFVKWVGLDTKNSLKQLKTANPNSPWACKGLLSEGYLRVRCLIKRTEVMMSQKLNL